MSKFNANAANNMRMPQIKKQKGVILLLTLLILSGILVVTLGAAEIVMSGIKMNRLTGYSSLAFFASEAGMERALYTARQPGYIYPDQNQTDVLQCALAPGLCTLANGSSYLVNYATSTPNVTFKSIGSYRGAKRSVESTYEVE
ncbi:MAG: hypothetical protein AUJ11_00165 [Parcubacteria group bacterium CG1_02_44_65]|nr:MAG: hypothetical protein AUJ11_00165 [Parcubacteria group bacterium CG1_02_44_65]